MTSVSAGHIILTPTQPVGSGRPQWVSNPGPPHQESCALPTELPPPPPPRKGGGGYLCRSRKLPKCHRLRTGTRHVNKSAQLRLRGENCCKTFRPFGWAFKSTPLISLMKWPCFFHPQSIAALINVAVIWNWMVNTWSWVNRSLNEMTVWSRTWVMLIFSLFKSFVFNQHCSGRGQEIMSWKKNGSR